jgi:hypothetical protein
MAPGEGLGNAVIRNLGGGSGEGRAKEKIPATMERQDLTRQSTLSVNLMVKACFCRLTIPASPHSPFVLPLACPDTHCSASPRQP